MLSLHVILHLNVVIEDDIIEAFSDKYIHSPTSPDNYTSSGNTAEQSSKRKRGSEQQRNAWDKEPAKPGEQVAAKVSSSNENGSWILGNVLDYDASRDAYEVQDEDDTSRTMLLGSREVKRLDDNTAQLRKGDGVLCVFPETTSFYRAVVAKNPKAPTHGNSNWELVVRFEDDEDASGVAPPRRVPGRFVLRRSDVEEDDLDD